MPNTNGNDDYDENIYANSIINNYYYFIIEN